MSLTLRVPGAGDPARSGKTDACLCTALRMLSRYASGKLDRVLAGHGLTPTEFQLMLMLSEKGPMRTLGLARRLRLDPGLVGRSLARLEQRGVVRRPQQWRYSEWVLEREGAIHLEVLEPIWHDLDAGLRSELGPAFAREVVGAVERLPRWIPRERVGWFD